MLRRDWAGVMLTPLLGALVGVFALFTFDSRIRELPVGMVVACVAVIAGSFVARGERGRRGVVGYAAGVVAAVVLLHVVTPGGDLFFTEGSRVQWGALLLVVLAFVSQLMPRTWFR